MAILLRVHPMPRNRVNHRAGRHMEITVLIPAYSEEKEIAPNPWFFGWQLFAGKGEREFITTID